MTTFCICSQCVANIDYTPHTLRWRLMCLKCHVPIFCFLRLSFWSAAIRHQNQRRSFKISLFAGSPSWKSPSWPLRAGLLTASEYKLLDIFLLPLSSHQLSQSREILLVRHAACFSSQSVMLNKPIPKMERFDNFFTSTFVSFDALGHPGPSALYHLMHVGPNNFGGLRHYV